MKRAQDIQPADPEEERLRQFDLREIDAPDQRSHYALKYVGRIEAVMRAIARHVRPGAVILEAGCAQANVSLLLAEAGFCVVGLDKSEQALRYACRKHERGLFLPVCGRVEALPVRQQSCDAVFCGELLEHCARPEEVLRSLGACLKDDGVLIITTMNGDWFGSPDPTYSQVQVCGPSKAEFGRAGEDHLFAFTRRELLEVVRAAGLRPIRVERHATVLHTDRMMLIKRLLAPAALRALSRFICRLPVIGPLTALTLLVIARPARKAGEDAFAACLPRRI